jgi:hypothetical protein
MMWSCNRNAERSRHRDDLLRHLDVGMRRRRIAGWVIVDEDHGCGRKLERPFDDLARIDRRVIDRTGLLHFVGNQLVALVEKKDAELFPLGEGLGTAAIVEHGRPGRECRPFFHFAAQQPTRRRLHDLDFGDAGLAEAFDFGKARDRRGDHFGE